MLLFISPQAVLFCYRSQGRPRECILPQLRILHINKTPSAAISLLNDWDLQGRHKAVGRGDLRYPG